MARHNYYLFIIILSTIIIPTLQIGQICTAGNDFIVSQTLNHTNQEMTINYKKTNTEENTIRYVFRGSDKIWLFYKNFENTILTSYSYIQPLQFVGTSQQMKCISIIDDKNLILLTVINNILSVLHSIPKGSIKTAIPTDDCNFIKTQSTIIQINSDLKLLQFPINFQTGVFGKDIKYLWVNQYKKLYKKTDLQYQQIKIPDTQPICQTLFDDFIYYRASDSNLDIIYIFTVCINAKKLNIYALYSNGTLLKSFSKTPFLIIKSKFELSKDGQFFFIENRNMNQWLIIQIKTLTQIISPKQLLQIDSNFGQAISPSVVNSIFYKHNSNGTIIKYFYNQTAKTIQFGAVQIIQKYKDSIKLINTMNNVDKSLVSIQFNQRCLCLKKIITGGKCSLDQLKCTIITSKLNVLCPLVPVPV